MTLTPVSPTRPPTRPPSKPWVSRTTRPSSSRTRPPASPPPSPPESPRSEALRLRNPKSSKSTGSSWSSATSPSRSSRPSSKIAEVLDPYLYRRLASALLQPYRDAAGCLLVLPVRLLAVCKDAPRSGVYPYKHQMHGPSLGYKGALTFVESDRYPAAQDLADDAPAGVLAPLVAEAVAGVLVENRLARAFRWIKEERQGVFGSLPNVVHLGPHRHGGVGADVEGRLAHGGVREYVGRAVEALSGPVVKPGALRQVDVAVLNAGAGYGGDEEGVAEQKLVVRVVGRLVFRVLEEEGP